MYIWANDKINIYNAIVSCKSIFKFVLKTKNEPELIELWINHHLSIKNCRQVIVFDNESTMPEVFEIYRKFSLDNRVVIVSFDGHHNLMHYPYFKHNLYYALINSAEYYMFLDTDEYVYQVDFNNGHLAKEIKLNPDFTWAPGVWISDVSDGVSDFKFTANDFNGGVLWGKPLISSSINILNVNSTINHNIQFFKCTNNIDFSCSIVVLHLKNSMPERRLRVNYEKLKKSHGLSVDLSYTAFLSQINDVEVFSSGVSYLNESKKILSKRQAASSFSDQVFSLSSDLKIKFTTSMENLRFINCFQYDRYLSCFVREVDNIDLQEIKF